MTDVLTLGPVGGATPGDAADISLLQYSGPDLVTAGATYAGAPKRYWKWTATDDGAIRVDAYMSAVISSLLYPNDRTIVIFTGPDSAHLTQVASGASEVTYRVTAGATYWIEVSISQPSMSFYGLLPQDFVLRMRMNNIALVTDWIQPDDRELFFNPAEVVIEGGGWHSAEAPSDCMYREVQPGYLTYQDAFHGHVSYSNNFGRPDPLYDGDIDYAKRAILYASHVPDAAGFHWTYGGPLTGSDPTAPLDSAGPGYGYDSLWGGLSAFQLAKHERHNGLLLPMSLEYHSYHGAQSISLYTLAKYATKSMDYTSDDLLALAGPLPGVFVDFEWESDLPTPNALSVRPDLGNQGVTDTSDPNSSVTWSTGGGATWYIGHARRKNIVQSVDYLGNIHGPSLGEAALFGPNNRITLNDADDTHLDTWFSNGEWHGGMLSGLPWEGLEEVVEVVAGDASLIALAFQEMVSIGATGDWINIGDFLDLETCMAMEAADIAAVVARVETDFPGYIEGGGDPLEIMGVEPVSITLLCGDKSTYDKPVPLPVAALGGTASGRYYNNVGYVNNICWLRCTMTPSRFRVVCPPPIVAPPTSAIDGYLNEVRANFIPPLPAG